MSAPRAAGISMRLVVGFVFLALTIIGTGWLVEWQQQGTYWVTHTLRVENELASVFSILEDRKSATQQFLLTGDDGPLLRANKAVADIPVRLSDLARQVADNPRQVAAVQDLRVQSMALLSALGEERAVSFHADPHRAAAAAALAQMRMDALRRTISQMRSDEERLLAQRESHAAEILLMARIARAICVLAILVLAGVAFIENHQRLADATALGEELARHVALLEAEAAVRAKAEAQVRQLQKMESIGQLTGGIAHDFNNMLAVVLGSLEMAKHRIGREQDKVEACIDNAVEGARRAAQLTSRLLAFSRQQPLEPQPLDANKLVGGISELLRRTIGEQFRVETVLAGGLWRAHADPAQLESAILNLCVNARDAMPDGGRLTIETANGHLDDAYVAAHQEVTAGQYVVVSVTDTGTGMPQEVVERAFEPFYTTKGVGKGTGLGLSQVYGFLKQSGGHVKIYSEPGHGTTVKLYLPRYAGEAEAVVTARMDSQFAMARGEGEIVLVVEDENQVREVCAETLRELGYTVVQAGRCHPGSGTAGPAAARRSAFHRYRYARHERQAARGKNPRKPAGPASALHDGLYPQRRHP